MAYEFPGDAELWPYSPRNGDDTEEVLPVLQAPAEIVLSPEDKQVAADFAQGLVHGVWGDLRVSLTDQKSGEPVTFGQIDKYSFGINKHTFYPDRLTRRYGATDRRTLGVYGHDPDTWQQIISRGVAAGRKYDLKALKAIARDEDTWQRQQLAKQLAKPAEEDADYQEPASFTINFTPERLLLKAEGWQAYRQFYRQIRRALREQPENDLREVMQTMLDVHVGAVNAKMTVLYPELISFKQQLQTADVGQTPGDWEDRLATVTPVFSQQPEPRPLSHYAHFLQRMDHVRLGVALDDGKITPISPKLLALAQRVEAARVTLAAEQPTPLFSPAELAAIKGVKWEAAQLKEFLDACLDEAGLLSSHPADWDEISTSEGGAPDGLWQSVVSPSTNMTNGRKRAMIVEDKPRLLDAVGPSGILGFVAHEFSHVLQNIQKKLLAQELPIIDAFGGRRYDTVHEMGALVAEEKMQAHLGHDRPIGLTYLRGLQQLVAGGSRLQVARAMYADIQATRRHRPAAQNRASAASMAQRLYRRGGFNSQPLDYSEQGLILDSLSRYDPRTIKAIALGASSFALRDTAALHRVGMYEIPDPDNVPDPVELVLRVFRKSFLPRLLAEQATKVA